MLPAILHHDGFDAEFGREDVGQVFLEAGVFFRMGGVWEDVGRAPFGIGAPAERSALMDRGESVRRRPSPGREREAKRKAGGGAQRREPAA